MRKFEITTISPGDWQHRAGDIVGIDNRVWVRSGPDYYTVSRVTKTGKIGRTYLQTFKSKYAARKFIKSKQESI